MHLLNKRDIKSEFSVGGNISDFQVHDILTDRINSSDYSLPSFLFGLLELLLGFLFFFDDPFNPNISKLHVKLINRGIWANRERVINLKEFIRGVIVSLGEADISQAI